VNTNRTLGIHALNTLALCYLPGVIAGWLQIYRGTKYSQFPTWLDNWLKMRKQLGLLMLFAASIHVSHPFNKSLIYPSMLWQACLSVAYMSPTYNEVVYGRPVEVSAYVTEDKLLNKTTVKVFGTEKMKWRGECFLMTGTDMTMTNQIYLHSSYSGVFGFALVVILGITSIPSVTLSWKEFAFIQSGLGWTALIFLCAHNMFLGWPYINAPSCAIPSSYQVIA
jgi:hypothetical protein